VCVCVCVCVSVCVLSWCQLCPGCIFTAPASVVMIQEAKARSAEKAKSPEDVARALKAQLEKMEEQRQLRMKGIDVQSSSSGDAKRHKQQGKAKAGTASSSASSVFPVSDDALMDNVLLDSKYSKDDDYEGDGADAETARIAEDGMMAQDTDGGMSDEHEDDEDDDDEEDDEGDGDDDLVGSDLDDLDEDSAAPHKSGSTAAPATSLKRKRATADADESHDEEDVTVAPDAADESYHVTSEEALTAVIANVPFTIPAPTNGKAFRKLISGQSLRTQMIIIERIKVSMSNPL